MSQFTKENLIERLQELSEASKRCLDNDELQEQIQEVRTKAEALIREHPLVSVGAGLLLGYLIGKLFSRD